MGRGKCWQGGHSLGLRCSGMETDARRGKTGIETQRPQVSGCGAHRGRERCSKETLLVVLAPSGARVRSMLAGWSRVEHSS